MSVFHESPGRLGNSNEFLRYVAAHETVLGEKERGMREPGRKQRKTKGEREGNKRKGSRCHDRISHLSQHREPRAVHPGKLLNQNALIFCGEGKKVKDKKKA
jgi:hypothetical protein